MTLEPHRGWYDRRAICARLHPAKNPSVGLFLLMPTVLRVGGFSLRINGPPREHGPPHVHVVRAGAEVIIMLGDLEAAPEVRRNRGMDRLNRTRAYRIVEEYQELLLERWRQYHG